MGDTMTPIVEKGWSLATSPKKEKIHNKQPVVISILWFKCLVIATYLILAGCLLVTAYYYWQ